jgi:lipopolysaccharide cholinephosphotransferase
MNTYIVCYCGNLDFELPVEVKNSCHEKIDLISDKVTFDTTIKSWIKCAGKEFFFIASRDDFYHIFHELIKAGISYDRILKPSPLTKEINIDGRNYLMREEFLTNPSKPIDRLIAKNNLILFQSVLEKHSIQFFLAFGTLLGAFREGDFIAHDSDTDVGMYLSDRSKFSTVIFDLHDAGLELVRFGENLLSFMREGEYIDLYFFKKKVYPKFGWYCNRLFMPARFLNRLESCEFLGRKFLTPWHAEEFLLFCYGADWRTPVKNKHAKPLSSFKSLIAKIFPLRAKKYFHHLLKSRNK